MSAIVLVTGLLAGCTASVTGAPGGTDSSTGGAAGTVTRSGNPVTLSGDATATSRRTSAPDTGTQVSTTSGTGPTSTTPTGSSPSESAPHVVVVLDAVTATGDDPSPADLQRSADILRGRIEPIAGATVTVRSPGGLVLEAPGNDITVFDNLVRPGLLNLRSVTALWPIGLSTTTSSTASTLPAVTTTTDPAEAFPPGSDPTVPTQPKADSAADWRRWMATAKGYTSGADAPSCDEIARYRGLDDPNKPLLACATDGSDGYLLGPAIIPGTAITEAEASQGDGVSGWTINVTFSQRARQTWSDYTTRHIGKQVAFVLDGGVLSAPLINGSISTATTMISGLFTETEATDLARWLDSGALPVAFKVDSRRITG